MAASFLLRDLSRPPHGGIDEVELPEEVVFTVEGQFDQFRLEMIRSHCLPVGFPYRPLLFEPGQFVI